MAVADRLDSASPRPARARRGTSSSGSSTSSGSRAPAATSARVATTSSGAIAWARPTGRGRISQHARTLLPATGSLSRRCQPSSPSTPAAPGSSRPSAGQMTTAIAKLPVTGPRSPARSGSTATSRSHPGHGGADRALCVYPSEHYAHWDAHVAPAFGENITARGVLEEATVSARRGGSARRRAGVAAALALLQGRRAARIPDLVMRARRQRIHRPAPARARARRARRRRHDRAARAPGPRRDGRRRRARPLRPAPDQGLVERVLAVPGLAAEWHEKTAPRLRRAA